MPKYEVGKRYVLFANAKDDWICPTVGWWQGRYEVRRDPATGTDLVHDSDGKPVYGFSGGAPLLRPRRKGDQPLKLTSFLSTVRRLIQRDDRQRAAKEAKERSGKDEETARPEKPAPPGKDPGLQPPPAKRTTGDGGGR